MKLTIHQRKVLIWDFEIFMKKLDVIFFSLFTAEARPYLVFANKDDIRFVEVSPKQFHSSKTTIVVKKLDDVAALDYFLAKNKVCWTEISSAVIRCSEVDPEKKGKVDKEIIVSDGLLKPEGKNLFTIGYKSL